MKWQLIESVPTDGRLVLLGYRPPVKHWRYMAIGYWEEGTWWSAGQKLPLDFVPAAWAALPGPLPNFLPGEVRRASDVEIGA